MVTRDQFGGTVLLLPDSRTAECRTGSGNVHARSKFYALSSIEATEKGLMC